MRTRTTWFAAIFAVCVLLAAACGDDDSNDTSSDTSQSPNTTAGQDLTSMMDGVTLVSEGKLTVCSDIPYEPFEFETDAGEVTGFDYDVVATMSESLGLDEPDFQTTPFDSIIPALIAGNCDIIASAMTITDERAEQVNFTEPYFDADQSLLVTAANEDTYTSLDSLAGKTIGVQSGTTGADYATENATDSTIQEFEGASELFAALAAGQIDAILQDYPVNAYRAKEQPDQFALTATFETDENYGIAMSLEATELLAALDAALAQMQSSGQYDTIYEEWFGTRPS